MKNKYKIVTDKFNGFEVQIRFWWFPIFWFQCKWTNTHCSVEQAEHYALKHANGTLNIKSDRDVEYLGELK